MDLFIRNIANGLAVVGVSEDENYATHRPTLASYRYSINPLKGFILETLTSGHEVGHVGIKC